MKVSPAHLGREGHNGKGDEDTRRSGGESVMPTRASTRSGRAAAGQAGRGRAATPSTPRTRRSTARSVASSTARPSTRSGSRTPARRRAVSSSRARGTGTRGDPPADETELASLRGLVDGLMEELQRKRDEAAGDRQQLQATIDDLIATQAAGPGLQGEVQLVGTTAPPPASRAPAAPSAEAAKAAAKDRARMWGDLRRVKAWLILGRPPAVAKLSQPEWQSLLRKGVLVTEKVAASLDTLSNFRVEGYHSGSDTPNAEVPLEESLSILITTISALLKTGITDSESLQRVGILEESLNVGLEMVTEHCRENRGEMRNPANKLRFAGFIIDDLMLFASRWFDAAISFKTTNSAPPTVIEDFPPVVTIEWKRITGFIAMGGVGAAALYQPQIRAGEQLLSPSKRARGTSSGRSRGYCFASNSSSGCHDRNCPYIHAQNPSHARRGASETPATGARERTASSVTFRVGRGGVGGSATSDKNRGRSVGHGNGGGRGGEARAAGEGDARPKTADFFTHGKDK